ncbi:MAG: radical SAM protein [Lachnospiraceae bacterium]|nr:radical SAM protein [Lachnospiraceae bacterium]
METFNLENYLTTSIENMIKNILKTSLKNPAASVFFMQYAKHMKEAQKIRGKEEKAGNHIPAFLIGSITTKCNLHCKGCYARANHSCFDGTKEGMPEMLSAEKWEAIFKEATDLGIGFTILIGGEPFVRKDVLLKAGAQKKMLFPVFTNGTMIHEEYLEILKENRNLLPVLSIEGEKETTDARRGDGVYQKLEETMKNLKNEGIFYGASITVHKGNLDEVLSDAFIEKLSEHACRAVFYVEYVPTTKESREIVLDDKDREVLMKRMKELRTERQDMMFIAFPGDEKSSGGCLAAGRGFFHINAYGGVEPCPFSPYSDTSLCNMTLREALHSPLFVKLNENGNLLKEHIGGCVLYEQEEQVKALVQGETA